VSRESVVSNLWSVPQVTKKRLGLRQFWREWNVGEVCWFRLLFGFVRFPVDPRLFLNLFCRLFRLNEVLESEIAPAGNSCRICRKISIFLDKV
jgi:hypothetical protein